MRRTVAAVVAVVALAACGGPSPEVAANSAGARIVRFHLRSALVGQDLPEVGVEPSPLASGARHPLLVFLHGRNGTPESGLRAAITMIADAGPEAPAIVLANGGPDSYWHDRRSGRWGTSLVRELIPLAARLLNADPGRVSIGGISMGGFGALDVGRLFPGRFCSIEAHSAAVWPTGGESAAGAFDDAQDFARHDLFGYARMASHPYGDVPVWIDVGASDGFRSNDAALAGLLQHAGARVTFLSWPGGHNSAYWASHLAQYAAFDARSLAACA
jgi:S-formylglutathione hydrolase FrmB